MCVYVSVVYRELCLVSSTSLWRLNPRRQNLYQHFATERDREERGLTEKATLDAAQPEKPRAGNTIFVSGNKVTEEFLKKTFNDYGTIVNVSMEIEKR